MRPPISRSQSGFILSHSEILAALIAAALFVLAAGLTLIA